MRQIVASGGVHLEEADCARMRAPTAPRIHVLRGGAGAPRDADFVARALRRTAPGVALGEKWSRRSDSNGRPAHCEIQTNPPSPVFRLDIPPPHMFS
jgi:hypothetical protein